MVPYEAIVVGFGGAMVGLLVWGVPNNMHQKIKRWTFLGLKLWWSRLVPPLAEPWA